jgi:hypothetical protein
MNRLEVLVFGAAPWVSPATRMVMQVLVAGRGRFGSAAALARLAGLSSRYQLGRLLARDGVPTLERLAAWIRLIGWMLEWEERRRSLCDQALKAGHSPASYYRTAADLTGETWLILRAQGVEGLFLRFSAECRNPARHRLETGAPARYA